MKSKKLLILIIVIALIVVAVVVFASVFKLKKVIVVCHDFAGAQILGESGSPNDETVLENFKGKNIIFLSKTDVARKVHQLYPDWYVFRVVKDPTNCIEVHCIKRVAFIKFDLGGKDIYIDSFGFKVDAPTDGSVPIDVSSAFMLPNLPMSVTEGDPFRFENDINNQRLSCILQCLMGLWECKVDSQNFPTILGESNVFTFDNQGTMTVTTAIGAKIHFMDPQNMLNEKFKKAFSVYCSEKYDLQKNGVEVVVWPDGKVTVDQKYITRL